MSNCRQSDFIWGVLVGGTVASLGVMLFTTKKGKQIQRHISDACDEVKDTFFEMKDRAQDSVEDAVEQGKKAFQKAKNETK